MAPTCITCGRAASPDDYICHKRWDLGRSHQTTCPVRLCRTCLMRGSRFLGKRRTKHWCSPCNELFDVYTQSSAAAACHGCSLPTPSTSDLQLEQRLITHLQRLNGGTSSTSTSTHSNKLVKECSLCTQKFCLRCQDTQVRPLPFCSSVYTNTFCGSELALTHSSSRVVCQECFAKVVRQLSEEEKQQVQPAFTCHGCSQSHCEQCTQRCANPTCNVRCCKSCSKTSNCLSPESGLCFSQCLRQCGGCARYVDKTRMQVFGCGHFYCQTCVPAFYVAHSCLHLECESNTQVCRSCSCSYLRDTKHVKCCEACYHKMQGQHNFLLRMHIQHVLDTFLCEDLAKTVADYVAGPVISATSSTNSGAYHCGSRELYSQTFCHSDRVRPIQNPYPTSAVIADEQQRCSMQ